MLNNTGEPNQYKTLKGLTTESDSLLSTGNANSWGNNYNLREWAIGMLANRKNFHKLKDNPDYSGQSEIYHSLFIHSDEVIKYINDNDNSIKDYEGAVAAQEIVIDVDCENDLAKALNITRDIVRKFASVYEVNLNCLRINFSGNKGFHIRIPAVLFGGFEASADLPSQIKSIVRILTDGFEAIDFSIYKTTGLIREVNTINGKSGLVSIPLSCNELFTLTIDEIKALAKSPRDFEYLDEDEMLPNEQLVALKNNDSSIAEVIDVEDGEVTEDRLGINELLTRPATEGNRHDSLVRIASHLIHYNVPTKTIYAVAELFNMQNNPPKDEKTVKKEVDGVIKQYKKIKGDFWSVSRNKGGRIVVDINHYQLVKFLESNGFAKLYLTNCYTYINSVDNRMKEKMSTEIKDFILDTVKTKNYQGLSNDFKDEILNTLIAGNNKYLGDKVFECVESREMELLKDTPELGRVFFKNCFVEITGSEIKARPYTELNGLIWEDQVLNADFDLVDDYNESMFRKFLWNISAHRQDRFDSLVSSIGYLLHGYKDMSKAKAIVFCDEKVSDDPNGRTGKSLASVAISKLKRSVRTDGKSIDFGSRFVYQQVERATQLLEFNDVRKSFDFESLFSIITDALNVEKKNGHKFSIDFKDSPKILISTNYTITGTGDSFTDRLFEVEFAPHYSAKHKPTDEFGCIFFDGWDKQEWDRFYNFMLWCEQFYLKNGLTTYEKVNLGIRKLMDNTAPEFLNFVEDQIIVGEEYDKNSTFFNFTIKYPDYLHLKQKTFTKWLSVYAESKGYEFQTRDSNGKGYFRLCNDTN